MKGGFCIYKLERLGMTLDQAREWATALNEAVGRTVAVVTGEDKLALEHDLAARVKL